MSEVKTYGAEGKVEISIYVETGLEDRAKELRSLLDRIKEIVIKLLSKEGIDWSIKIDERIEAEIHKGPPY